MDKRLIAILVYETFATGALATCPLPHDQVYVTGKKDCREDFHIEQHTTSSATSTTVSVTTVVSAGPIMPGSSALTLTTSSPYVPVTPPSA